MRITSPLLGLVLLAGWPAAASGGASCRVSEVPVRFSIGTAIGRSSGAFFRGGGDVQVADATVAADFKRVRFTLEHLVHRWLDDGELKLGFYRERTVKGPHGYVSLKIEAKADPSDEGSYLGRYRIRIHDVGQGSEPVTVSREGNVTCQVE